MSRKPKKLSKKPDMENKREKDKKIRGPVWEKMFP